MKAVNVLLCDCGKELCRTINFEELEKYISSMANVNSVKRVSFLCSDDGQNETKQFAQKGADRLVIAACSPKLYEPLFKKCVAEGGLNPFLVEIANIREQVAWPHADDLSGANDKAKLVVAAAVNRVLGNEAIEEKEFKLENSVLVVGSGVAGLQAATDIANFGHKVTLIEKAPVIGGNALKLGLAFPTDDGAFCITSFRNLPGVRKCFYRASLNQHPNLKIQTLTEAVDLKGSFGNFEVKSVTQPRGVKQNLCTNCGKCSEVCPVTVANDFNYGMSQRKAIYLPYPNSVPAVYTIDFNNCTKCGKCVEVCPFHAIDLEDKVAEQTQKYGSIVLATGFQEFDPSVIKQYKYAVDKDVITQLQLSRILDPFGPTNGVLVKPSDGQIAKGVTIIQCVGSRDACTNSYCSKICCMFGLKHAIQIKEKFPETEVYFCYMDIRAGGKGYEEYFTKARELGVIFVRGKPSEINRDPATGKLVIDVEDTFLNRPLEIESDIVALSVALKPSEGTSKLAGLMGVNIDSDGFVQELYSKLKQVETNVHGIYVCGAAQSPKDIPESVTQGQAVALQVISDLKDASLQKKMDIAFVDEEKCDGCKVCVEVCPYAAPKMVEITAKDGKVASVARIDESKCNKCGTCSSRCPTGAIQLKHYSDEQVFNQLQTLLSKKDTALSPRIIAFCCDECGYAAVDMAGMGGKKYAANVLPVRVPCLGWVSLYQIFKAFEFGADGVLLTGCIVDNCHHMKGASSADKVVTFAKEILDGIGLGSKRLEMVTLCAAEPTKFLKATETLKENITALGPLKNQKLNVKVEMDGKDAGKTGA